MTITCPKRLLILHITKIMPRVANSGASACWTKPHCGEKISAAAVLISGYGIPGFLNCTSIRLNGGRR